MPVRLGVTLGDPAGIGPEIIDKALSSNRLHPDLKLVVLGKRNGAEPGQPTSSSAAAALAAMVEAAELAVSGQIDGIVTGPIHKARMAEIGFAFAGQTEFFAASTRTTNYAMLLTAGAITVALVTTHIPLREVSGALTTSEIVRVSRLLLSFLHRRGIQNPRIVIAGFNPHAGETGRIGREEIEVIAPAVRELQSEMGNQRSATWDGPCSPDTLFHHLAQGKWHAAVCMYHDQGLIPVKLHGFDFGVNVTLGLPYPRTSPDHGTAFDIAGKDMAKPDSMIAAINLAGELATT